MLDNEKLTMKLFSVDSQMLRWSESTAGFLTNGEYQTLNVEFHSFLVQVYLLYSVNGCFYYTAKWFRRYIFFFDLFPLWVIMRYWIVPCAVQQDLAGFLNTVSWLSLGWSPRICGLKSLQVMPLSLLLVWRQLFENCGLCWKS